jgi:hypothetical protein
LGEPVTSGLSQKRGSRLASLTTNTCSLRIAWPQNEIFRAVSQCVVPCFDLNHWRFSSTRLTRQISTPNSRFAMRVTRSNRSSDGVSRIRSECRLLSRSISSSG